MRPRRILMTADAVGGVWTYSLDLARELTKYGVQTTLATMGPRPSGQAAADASSIPGLQLVTSDYKLEWMDSPWTDVDAAGEWLLELCEEIQPDVVHLNGYAHASVLWPVPSVVVAHSCVYAWWNAVHGADPPEQLWSEYRRRVCRGLCAASAVAAVSTAAATDLHVHYGFDGAWTIPNGRDARSYSSAAVKQPFVLTCGRIWDTAKNIAVLEQAAQAAAWPVYAAGSTSHPDGSEVKPLHIHALGHLEPGQVLDWYARASVYAAPALYEPFGLSVLEAALSGCALVLADIPSLRENWSHAALFVQARDACGWTDALNRLAEDVTLRTGLAHAAQERAAHFTLERQARKYIHLYEEANLNFSRTQEPEARMTCAS